MSIRACVQSCLDQTIPADQIVVVNDGSTDFTSRILEEFGRAVTVVSLTRATGNKSYAQEVGLRYITGDIFITTDADTILHPRFVEVVKKEFADGKVAAVGGYVRSLHHNWLTALRELDYVVGQEITKVAQAHMNAIFVIPGCAGAFRTNIFRNYLHFDHDTVTEDLDFTYKLHENFFTIVNCRDAIVYTQDPATLFAYIQQMRRWYAGGWQNLIKHASMLKKPANALQLSLMYVEGLAVSTLLYWTIVVSPSLIPYIIIPQVVLSLLFGIYAGLSRSRLDLCIISPLYPVMFFVNTTVFLEQFVREVVLRKENLTWHIPARRENIYTSRSPQLL